MAKMRQKMCQGTETPSGCKIEKKKLMRNQAQFSSGQVYAGVYANYVPMYMQTSF